MPIVRYTLKHDAKISTVDLARWLSGKTWKCNYTLEQRLTIARALVKGEGWEPPYHTLKDPNDGGPCDVKIELDPDDQCDAIHLQFAKQAEYRELLRKGAEGDAEAAIAWCRLEMEGRISHGAYS